MASGDDFLGSYNPRVHAKVAEREGFLLSSSDDPKTLWVGNVDPAITDDFLATIFNQIAVVVKTKTIFDGLNDPYAFIEFSDNHQASIALQALDKREILGKQIRVYWAMEPGQQDRAKMDSSRHYHVFVGDLSPEVDNQKLKEAFSPFGEVLEAKIIRDTVTNKSKGYGFVSYQKREEAERAIEQMNGQWLGRRTIRTNWASRKPEEGGYDRGRGDGGHHGGYGDRERDRDRGGRREDRFDRNDKTFEDIFNMTGPDNITVYVGNIQTLSEDDLRRAFERFGRITDVRTFKMQGYAFVKFEEKACAAKAILEMNNQEVKGTPIRCSWGKTGDSKNDRGGPGGGNYGYGYGPGGPGGHGGFPGGNFNNPPPPPPPPPGGPGGPGGNYWQHYANYYNNPNLMPQWPGNWQGGGGPPRGPPPRHHK